MDMVLTCIWCSGMYSNWQMLKDKHRLYYILIPFFVGSGTGSGAFSLRTSGSVKQH